MSLINTYMNAAEVSNFKAKLIAASYAVIDFGHLGFCSEVDGMQVFRATAVAADSFDVRYNERMFPDV